MQKVSSFFIKYYRIFYVDHIIDHRVSHRAERVSVSFVFVLFLCCLNTSLVYIYSYIHTILAQHIWYTYIPYIYHILYKNTKYENRNDKYAQIGRSSWFYKYSAPFHNFIESYEWNTIKSKYIIL